MNRRWHPANWFRANPFVTPTEGLIRQLGQLVQEYRFEARRHTGDAADRIWESAWTLDRIRHNLADGRISYDDAAEWLAAGVSVLTALQRERAEANHPAGKAPR